MEGDTCPAEPPAIQEARSPKSPLPSPTSELEIKVNVSPKSERASPEPNCAICLGKSENKSFTDSCLHQFCFKCLLEWSKVKAECPLCKQHFKSIIHNVRSNEDYDQYHLRPAERPNPYLSNMEFIRRFSYRSTLTPERRREMLYQDSLSPIHLGFTNVVPNHRIPSYYRRRRHATSEFRKHIYLRNLWVDPLPDITGRYRESSPEFYRLNPAQMHRLVPWLNRELNVLTSLLHNSSAQVVMLLDLILGYLVRHPICGDQFRSLMSPHLGHYSSHFLHEFNAFARSPYDMIGFDESASYVSHTNLLDVDSSSSSDSDVIILSPEPEASNSETAQLPRNSSQTSFASRISEPCLTTETSPVIPESPSTSPISPIAGPSGRSTANSIMLMLSGAFRSHMFPDIDLTSCGTSSSGASLDAVPQTSRAERGEPSDPEDCMIVGYVKPRHERTPEIITLDSDADVIEGGEVNHENISTLSSKDFSDCMMTSPTFSSSSCSSGSEYVPYEAMKRNKKQVKKRSSSSKSLKCSRKCMRSERKRKIKHLDSTSSSDEEFNHKESNTRDSRKRKLSHSSDSSFDEDKSWSHRSKGKLLKNNRREIWRILTEHKDNEEDNGVLDCAGPSYEPPYTASEIATFTDKSRPKLRSIVITRSSASGKGRDHSHSPVASSSRSSPYHLDGNSRSSSHKMKHKSRKRLEKKKKKERRSSSSSSYVTSRSSKCKRKKKRKSKKLFSSSSSESS